MQKLYQHPASTLDESHAEMSRIRVKANLIVELDAPDYISAASHQRKLEELLAEVRASYPTAKLVFTERRGRGANSAVRARGRASGALQDYSDS
jgi:hypothetical protein